MLGGRKEVVTAPAVELLQFMDMELDREDFEQEKEQYRIWLNYLIAHYNQPSFGKEDPKMKRSREEFVEMIQPKPKPKEIEHTQTIVYDWDDEVMKRLKARQEGG